jgi:ATP-dependent helicase/nuclease subunit B
MKSFKTELKLLIGPAGSGKTHQLIHEFSTALKASEHLLKDDLLFILPTAEHRERVIELVLRQGLPGFFHRRITTFDRALRSLLRLGGIEFATDVTRTILLRTILSRSEFQYFGEARHSSGFLELIGKLLIELKENLIQPAELNQKFEPLKKKFPEFSLKYEDLGRVYTAYDKALKEQKLMDQRDSLRLLEEGLKRGEYQASHFSQVWIDGFSDFSNLQLAFIEFLVRHSDQVTTTLTLDDNPYRRAPFEVVSETRARLEEIGFKPQFLKDQNYRARTRVLEHIEKNIFHEGAVEPVASDASLQIFESTGMYGEVEMAAREIKKLAVEHAYYFSDIAIVLRKVDPYVSALKSVFLEYGLPFELHERLRLRLTPIARILKSFFRILLDDWRRDDLFNFLKASCVPDDYEGMCELELRALQKGIYRDRKYWLETFPNVAVLKTLSQFQNEFDSIRSIIDFSKWVRYALTHFGFFEFFNEVGAVNQEARASVRRVTLLLDELVRKRKGHKNDTAIHFANEFLTLIEVDLFSVHSRDKNKVQIYHVSLARQKEYKAVFVLGLLEKEFPIQLREDPILSDRERRALNETGEVLNERLPRQSFERYLFYLSVTRARERLVLSFPRFNLEGKEALPSFYVDEVRRLFQGETHGKKQHVTDVLPHASDVSTVREARRKLLFDLFKIPFFSYGSKQATYEGGGSSFCRDFVISLHNHFLSDTDFKSVVSRLIHPIEGVIRDERIQPHFLPPRGSWSATMLEEYGECPYRFFSHRLLHLEDQVEGIDIRRRGTILHSVLEQFFRWMHERPTAKISFEHATTFCMNVFRKEWEQEPLTGERYYKIELERKRMEEMILQVLRNELVIGKPPLPTLHPTHFEFQFKDFVLKGESRDIPLTGFVDRIDVDPSGQYALVVDYKTGKSFSASQLENGTSLQLPFYLLAVQQKLGLKPLGGHLYALSKGASSGFHHKDNLVAANIKTRKGNQYSKQAFERVTKRAVVFSEKYIDGIERAQIPVRPRECVSFCSYSSVCRIEKWRLKHLYQEIAEEDTKIGVGTSSTA